MRATFSLVALVVAATGLGGCFETDGGSARGADFSPTSTLTPGQQGVRISGLVTDEADQALPEVHISLELERGASYTTSSRGDGGFEFLVPPADSCRLTASKPGFYDEVLKGPCIGDTHVPIRLHERPGGDPAPSPSPSPSASPGSSSPPPGNHPPSTPPPPPQASEGPPYEFDCDGQTVSEPLRTHGRDDEKLPSLRWAALKTGFRFAAVWESDTPYVSKSEGRF